MSKFKKLRTTLNFFKIIHEWLWLYFVFMLILLLGGNKYISDLIQATLIIACFPLMWINTIHTDRVKDKLKLRNNRFFIENCFKFPKKVKYGDNYFIFKEIITVRQGDYEYDVIRAESGNEVIITFKQDFDDYSVVVRYIKERKYKEDK